MSVLDLLVTKLHGHSCDVYNPATGQTKPGFSDRHGYTVTIDDILAAANPLQHEITELVHAARRSEDPDVAKAVLPFATVVEWREGPPVTCEGCGSHWTDADLARERRNNPKLLSCCPERNPIPEHIENAAARMWRASHDDAEHCTKEAFHEAAPSLRRMYHKLARAALA